MSIAIINTGTSPNSGNGDSLRSAFIKINNNFSYLESSVTSISIIQGPTGPAGEIGPTGPAGLANIEFGNSNYAAYYPSNGTIITATNIINFNIPSNVLSIGALGNTTTRIVHTLDTYFTTTSIFNKFTFLEHHEFRDVNNFVFHRARGDHNNPLPIIANDDIADITFTTINNQNSYTGVATITVSVVSTATTDYPVGIFKLFLNQGNNILPVEVLDVLSSSTLKVDTLDSLTTGTSLQVINNLVPATDSTYDLGSTSSQWNNLFLNNSLQFSDNTTQTTAYNLLDAIPESSTSTGIKGQMAVSTTSLYVCVATNSWLKFDGTTF